MSDDVQNEVAKLFLAFSSQKLEHMTVYLNACLDRLSDEQVWQRQGAYENSVANLVLHLCGNMRQWVLFGVDRQPDVRVRDAEFSATAGMSAAELKAMFGNLVSEVRRVIDALPAERLLERTTPQGSRSGEISVLDAIYQVVGHVQQHVGQILLLTKQMTASDLDLSIPRPR